ncbi:hypothetical protein GCM10020220_081640 [Nonomuraea rubra]|uniref:hypothetical protein n=1 Tax=Nonomuraea rubra TaxID=46180 RepID=UPI0031E78D5E
MAGSIRRVSLTPSLAGSIATVNSLEPFPAERPALVGQGLRQDLLGLRQPEADLRQQAGARRARQPYRPAGGQREPGVLRARARQRGLGVAARLEPVDDVLGRIGRVERAHALGVGEGAVADVVEVRVVLGGDPHRPRERHRHLDVDAAGALVGVAHHRVHERRAEPAVHHVLEARLDDLDAVQLDGDPAGAGDVAAVPGEPDGLQLARAGVLGDHAALGGGAQAGVGALEPVVVVAGAVEAGELLGLDADRQLGQPVEPAVDVPAHRALGGGRGGGGLRRGGEAGGQENPGEQR